MLPQTATSLQPGLRRLVAGAFVVLAVSGCGSSSKPLPQNGLIAANRNGFLYLMKGDGSGRRKVPDGRLGPALWTPDGKWLAFNPYGRVEFWLMRPDASDRRLVAHNVPLGAAAISSDGKTMAFANDSGGPAFASCGSAADNAEEIYTIGVDGRGRRRLTHNCGYDGGPSWSPDGKRIVYETDDGVRIMDRDGQNSHVLAPDSSYPLWSPQGDEILISTGPGWGLVAPEGGEIEYLKPGPQGPEGGMTWSPDGRRIAYQFRPERMWTAEDPLQLWVMNADGSGRHPITKTFGWSIPSWASAS